MARKKAGAGIGRWFLLWTSIGCIFALQLRWYYDLPWSVSFFWGLVDWYLWGLLALGIFSGVRLLGKRGWRIRSRVLLYAVSGPVIAALHVVLTMILGSGIGDLPIGLDWTSYFQTLYAKKLTLNLLTFAAVVATCEHLAKRAPEQDGIFLARKGNSTRLVRPDQIIWGEVCGNYVNLHTEDGMWPVRETLTRLTQQLPEQRFLKISRSLMVNLDRVRELSTGSGAVRIGLSDGSTVRVARRHAARVRQAIRDYCASGETDR